MPRAQSYPGNTRGTMIAHTRTGAPPSAWGGVRIRQRRGSQGSPGKLLSATEQRETKHKLLLEI